MQIELSLPDHFLEPEDRAGIHIPAERKKIWAVELDLLHKFSEVCEKHQLSYFLDGGTLLGAIRHGGFIPWDDDVDVIMPREDYDKLWGIAAQEFTYPYFFQTPLSEDGFFRTHAQLRNSSTTGFIPIDAEKPQINKGIWLDVFVLDGVADGLLAAKLQRKWISFRKDMLRMAYDAKWENQHRLYHKIMFRIFNNYYNNHSFKRAFDAFNHKVLAKHSFQNTKWVGDLTLRWRENCQWPRVYYSDYCYLPFEFLKLRAPLFSCEIMARQYGDYMRMPKDPSENLATHRGAYFDPDTPYTEFDFEKYFAMQGEEKEVSAAAGIKH